MTSEPENSQYNEPSNNRDWFFPSSSFFHSNPNQSFKTLNPSSSSRKAYSNKTLTGSNYAQNRSQRTVTRPYYERKSFSSFEPSIPRSDGRKKAEFYTHRRETAKPALSSREKQKLPPEKPVASMENRKSSMESFKGRIWTVAFPVLISCLCTLLHNKFSLRDQVKNLQDQIHMLNAKLQACDISTFVSLDEGNPPENALILERSFKFFSLVVAFGFLLIIFIFAKYVDCLPRSRRSNDNNKTLEEVSLSKQLAYHIDVALSVHPYAKPLALLVATLLLICLGGLALFGVTDDNLWDCLWLSWTYVADSGNHTSSVGFGPKFVSISISFGGMLIFAMMLGLVSDSISEKFDSLRKGRSEVIEKNHTLILGWSDKLGSLLNQLAIANESLGGGMVVVLAERDKEEMELDIAKMEFDFKGTSVICRSGSPLIIADLKKVSVSKARAIVVLAEDGNADQSDARALRTVLSLTGVKDGLRGHIVVELSDLDNELLVKLVGGDLVETVVAHDVIGRLMIQCARQPGLAQVASNGGKIFLNPYDGYVLQEGDEVLVIAEDDDTYAPTTLPQVWRGSLPKDFSAPKLPERILYCGWRRDMEDMIMVLDAFLAPGSELWMFNDVPEKEREKKLIDGGLDINRLENISLVHREGNAVIRRHLESLPLETFDSILILADESVEDSAIQADSRSLATLLLIRDIQARRLPFRESMPTHANSRGSHFQSSWIGEMQQASDNSVIISEILDPRTKNLLCMSRISDYVLSNELVSMALAMVAEDRQVNKVLEELFAEEGNEMQLRHADLYVREEEELSFYEIMLRARQRKEIVIGYRLASAERAIINPTSKEVRRRWSGKDVFVVIAEKE
ncbi:probable ion channel CASTOR isoform X4 [Amborella trichopoda]|uniref:probable ion channel CASTOR isoform X4 n=1 Tax=Amborella trichopoda TaxID=13333 RepID=UPI0009BEDD97|nr:probable ion channel CASTOR isoform X4 [Amborella trichopoda]|eukprot:XP_020531993.1 probable ion channel CASTOR isoform X4 [Amborella trichopoda]